jgi:hypothetical protein
MEAHSNKVIGDGFLSCGKPYMRLIIYCLTPSMIPMKQGYKWLKYSSPIHTRTKR